MEGTEVNVLECQLFVVVSTIVTVVESIVTRSIKTSFTAPGDKMVLIERLDICAHLVDPFGDPVGSTIVAAR